MAFFFFGNCTNLSQHALEVIVAYVQVRIKLTADGLLSRMEIEEDYSIFAYSKILVSGKYVFVGSLLKVLLNGSMNL